MSPEEKNKLAAQLQLLKDLYLAIGEAYAALRDKEKTNDQVARLHKEIESQESRIQDYLVLIRAHELNSGDTMEICPRCKGAGAILRGPDDAEECNLCDGVGARVKEK